MNDKNGRASGRERGAVLIVAILLMVCMAIMAAPFLSRLSGQYRSTDRGQSMAAFNLAGRGGDGRLRAQQHVAHLRLAGFPRTGP
jgi:type II secretory pathway component PulK